MAKLADKSAAARPADLQELFQHVMKNEVDSEEVTAEQKKYSFLQALQQLPAVLDAVSDKDKAVAEQAKKVATIIVDNIDYWGVSAAVVQLQKCLGGKAKPPTKEFALHLIEKAAKRCPDAFRHEINQLIHSVSMLCNDAKQSVKSAAKACLLAMCNTCGNRDLTGNSDSNSSSENADETSNKSFIPTIARANESPKFVEECVEKLASCVFVQNVKAPHLAVMTPILFRGLNTKSEACQRQCCVIVDNMCKLVDDPREGEPLFGEVMALVEKRAKEMSDPEAREMAMKTFETIQKLHAHGPKPELDIREVMNQVDCSENSNLDDPTIKSYLQLVTNRLSKANVYNEGAWIEVCSPFIDSDATATAIMDAMACATAEKEVDFIDDDETCKDLYKGCFSLAFGTVTLLRDAKLHLKRNKFYALLGPNNCGKSTLMKAISMEKVKGFPKRDELLTIFVSHNIDVREIEGPSENWPEGKTNLDLNGIEFVVDTVNNVYKKSEHSNPITKEDAERELGTIGFKNKLTGVNVKAAADMLRPITDYSGGWKMKMQLACAKLLEADILMLDEPTGHLDVVNVEWMKDWLRHFVSPEVGGSVIAASTNAAFLDEMCTHVIDFDSRKLRQFKGVPGSVLSAYTAEYPEKQTYFELSDRNQKFNFPKPGALEGVKSRGRAVLKMTDVCFKYPLRKIDGEEADGKKEKETPNIVQDICLSACMASRIAVVGPNGSGKSTAIKLLIGEIKPDSGTLFRHPGLRLAYVAQHSLKHLKDHLDKTPVQYILWRFAGNDDRESLENQNKELDDDEEALQKVDWCVDPASGVVRKCVAGVKGDVAKKPECVLNRRKNNKSKTSKYDYEVKWQFTSAENTTWVERETIVAMGYEQLACREDEKQAYAQGLMSKPLTQQSVQAALKDFGIGTESASHVKIKSLSEGQMFKVVLAAAMWQNPHILILDEPTNYLDRDGIGALTMGLQSFEGGVVIISHDWEFAGTVCPEQKWKMDAGILKEEGEIDMEAVALKEQDPQDKANLGPQIIVDSTGNEIEVSKESKMKDKERKRMVKEIEKKLRDNKKKPVLNDEEVWELEDRLKEHKEALGMEV